RRIQVEEIDAVPEFRAYLAFIDHFGAVAGTSDRHAGALTGEGGNAAVLVVDNQVIGPLSENAVVKAIVLVRVVEAVGAHPPEVFEDIPRTTKTPQENCAGAFHQPIVDYLISTF